MFKKKRKVGRPSNASIRREKNKKIFMFLFALTFVGVSLYSVKDYIRDNSNKIGASIVYTCPDGYINNGWDTCYKKANEKPYLSKEECNSKGTGYSDSEYKNMFCEKSPNGKWYEYKCSNSETWHNSKDGLSCRFSTSATVNYVENSNNVSCPEGYFLYHNKSNDNLRCRSKESTGVLLSDKKCPYKDGTEERKVWCGKDSYGQWYEYTCGDFEYALWHDDTQGTVCSKFANPIVNNNSQNNKVSYNIKDAYIVKIPDQTYTGKKIKPTISIYLNCQWLKKGEDYKVKYTNNKKVGTAKVKITGIGKYKGTKKVTFKILGEFNSSMEGVITDTNIQESSATPKPNRVKIQIDVNGGKVNSNGLDGYGQSGSLVTQNGSTIIDSVKYGSKLGTYGLTDPNSKSKLNITKKGYKVEKASAYKCKSGCTKKDKVYSAEKQYKASDFCDASNGDCTVTLKVNWKKK